LSQQSTSTDISEVIAENFGANATYVEGLLNRFRSNPQSVDDSWRAYFTELLGDSGAAQPDISENGRGSAVAVPAAETPEREPAKAATPVSAKTGTAAAPERKAEASVPASVGEAIPIRGGALKIVENMEASLAVPTATSQRRIPVKLLDENRRIINTRLAENDRGKASYTHLIAWAILRALDKFPQLNDGYQEAEGVPVRLRRESINFGVAIDLEKKDGSRTLLVPNIKNANSLSFSKFLAAYDDVVKRARQG